MRKDYVCRGGGGTVGLGVSFVRHRHLPIGWLCADVCRHRQMQRDMSLGGRQQGRDMCSFNFLIFCTDIVIDKLLYIIFM